jgi:riboflavin kinase/FMN adenylyltransferase
MGDRTVLTIGNFDGVHLGHAALIARARELAGPAGRVVALAFDPHPATTLSPEGAPARLSTFGQRDRWLRDAGADAVERLEPTPEFLAQTPEAFVDALVRGRHPVAFVEGEDFHFGRRRAGNNAVLAELGASRGFAVDVVPPVTVDLTDQTIVTCSSGVTRWLLSNGRVRDAARVLGRPYTVQGAIRRGDQRGRTIGFPTANVETTQAPPADGVYAATATVPSGGTLAAAVHVGPRATFDCGRRTIEAYLLDWDDPIADYGWEIELRFVSFLRGQARFDTVGDLVAQMRRDVERARRRVGADAVRRSSPEPASA